jgi:hypothetical protein
MLRRLLVLSVVSVPFFALGAGVSHANPPPSPCALRAEGYGGMGVLDFDGQSKNQNEANAGGTGSGACLFGPIHFQVDTFGDYTDTDKAFGVHTESISNVGGGGHLGLADPNLGAIEVNGAYNHIMLGDGPNDGFWRIGGEGEFYLDAFTLGVQAGYLKSTFTNADGSGYYARGMLRYYPIEEVKLEGVGGVGTVGGNVVPQMRIEAEYRPQTWPVGFFTRLETAWDQHVDQYFATGGVRLYLFDQPATLRETDRRYFRNDCVEFLVGARTC